MLSALVCRLVFHRLHAPGVGYLLILTRRPDSTPCSCKRRYGLARVRLFAKGHGATMVEEQDTTVLSDLLRSAQSIPQLADLWAGLTAIDIEQVERIFLHNFAVGRAQRVWRRGLNPPAAHEAPGAGDDACWPLAYLRQVLRIYRQEGARLHALTQGDDTAWQRLCTQLTTSAYYLLVQKGFDAPFARELAHDMAQQTCCKIYDSSFPCDVAFDTWAHVILKNQILHQLTRSTELLDRQLYIESLEVLQAEQEDRYGFMPLGQGASGVGHSSAPLAQIEEQEWLLGAIAQLSSLERRAVLVYTFFYGLSDEEIAHHLGKSTGAIHTLRHRALKQLQGVLLQEQPPVRQAAPLVEIDKPCERISE